jgi:hypothetical protein
MTFQQLREAIALILHNECQCGTREKILHERQQRLIRNVLACYYHWKRRKLLAPLNISKRQI